MLKIQRIKKKRIQGFKSAEEQKCKRAEVRRAEGKENKPKV